jgi:hypothetical protein
MGVTGEADKDSLESIIGVSRRSQYPLTGCQDKGAKPPDEQSKCFGITICGKPVKQLDV